MNKKIDIICTIGPSSWDIDVLAEMIRNGMTIARLNGAFADEKQLLQFNDSITEACRKVGVEVLKDVKLLMDTKGVEVRLNRFEQDIIVQKDEIVTFGSNENSRLYTVTYPEMYRDLVPGTILKIDKGKVVLEVQSIDKDKGEFDCIVRKSGAIQGGRGVNVIGVILNNKLITNTDLEQIKFALNHNWNYVALSMISTSDQLLEVKKEIESKNFGHNPKYISKIETPEGAKNIENIAKNCDGIMIGRGDMAVNAGYEKVPEIQAYLQKFCRENGFYHIVATELLESMKNDSLPSNADVSDITKAILGKADALMLSGETTQGKYPAECVKVLRTLADYYSK